MAGESLGALVIAKRNIIFERTVEDAGPYKSWKSFWRSSFDPDTTISSYKKGGNQDPPLRFIKDQSDSRKSPRTFSKI